MLDIGGRHVSASLGDKLSLTAGEPVQLEVVKSGNPVILRLLTPGLQRDTLIAGMLRTLLPRQIPLQNMLATISSLGTAPQPLVSLLRLLPHFQQLGSERGLEQAIINSGIFLENKLFSKTNIRTSSIERDLKGILLRLLGKQGDTGNKSLSAAALRQQIEGGIARIQVNQLGAVTTDGTSWLFEIPFREEGRFGALQLQIRKGKDASPSSAEKRWSVSMEFELQSLGPLQIILTLQDENRVTVGIWAQRENTLNRLISHHEKLQNALQSAGLIPLKISHHHGRKEGAISQENNLTQRLLDISV